MNYRRYGKRHALAATALGLCVISGQGALSLRHDATTVAVPEAVSTTLTPAAPGTVTERVATDAEVFGARPSRQPGRGGAPTTRPSAPVPPSPTPTPSPTATPSASVPTTAPSTKPTTSAPVPTTSAPVTTAAPTGGAGTGTGTGGGAGTYASSQEFLTPVAQGAWPGDGRAPSAYPNYLTYEDGTSGKYYPSKVLSVHDGVLDWNCHASMAAAVLPFGYEGFTYGTYTVRMRTDRFDQYHIAFLLWPVTNQWTHEIDGPEQETSQSKPYPAVLQSTNPTVQFQPSGQLAVPKSWNDAAFHDYTWQWAPGSLTFYQDGVKVTTVTSNVPAQPMRPVLQVEFSNQLAQGQKPDPSITGHVYVDRVAYDPSYTMAVPLS